MNGGKKNQTGLKLTHFTTLRDYRTRHMKQVLDNIKAEQVFSEMSRRGVKPHQRVRVAFEIIDEEDIPLARIAQDGKAFDWLADEPDLYTHDDLKERNV